MDSPVLYNLYLTDKILDSKVRQWSSLELIRKWSLTQRQLLLWPPRPKFFLSHGESIGFCSTYR